MKSKIILTSIFFLICLKFYGQNYNSTIGNTNSWKVVKGNIGFSTMTYYTNGATTYIDSVEFKNVYSDNSSMEFRFIREDTILKKIYWTNDIITKFLPIFILCDFSLQENDSIELYDFSIYDIINLGFYRLDSVRYLQTLLGQKKYFYLSSKNLIDGHYENPVWIEGVGPLGDLMHPGRSPKEQNFGALSCSFKNSEQTFISQHAIDFGNCDIFVDIQELSLSHTEIFPNPSNEFLIIRIGDNVTNEILLLNNLGQIIISKIVKGTDKINIKDLKTGIYYLKILSNEQSIIKKIIIEK